MNYTVKIGFDILLKTKLRIKIPLEPTGKIYSSVKLIFEILCKICINFCFLVHFGMDLWGNRPSNRTERTAILECRDTMLSLVSIPCLSRPKNNEDFFS